MVAPTLMVRVLPSSDWLHRQPLASLRQQVEEEPAVKPRTFCGMAESSVVLSTFSIKPVKPESQAERVCLGKLSEQAL
jgi:hypothetical protein